jgi:hypothetical protein
MPVWPTRSIDEVPEVALTRWRIMRTDTGLYFVGARPERGTCRVSTCIVEIDVVNRTGVTRSGRKYLLEGAAGSIGDEDSAYVWLAWCQANGVTDSRDITDEVMGSRGGMVNSIVQ